MLGHMSKDVELSVKSDKNKSLPGAGQNKGLELFTATFLVIYDLFS